MSNRQQYIHTCFSEENGHHEEKVYSFEIGEDCTCSYCGEPLLTQEEAVKFIYEQLFH